MENIGVEPGDIISINNNEYFGEVIDIEDSSILFLNYASNFLVRSNSDSNNFKLKLICKNKDRKDKPRRPKKVIKEGLWQSLAHCSDICFMCAQEFGECNPNTKIRITFEEIAP